MKTERATQGVERLFKYNRIRDLLLSLPLLAFCLLMTPVLDIFSAESDVFGIPIRVVQLFGSWFILIVLIWRFTRKMAHFMKNNPNDP